MIKLTEAEKKQLLSYFADWDISRRDDFNRENYEDFYKFSETVRQDIEWVDFGITKIVFAFRSFPKIVVKIPFNGSGSMEALYRLTYDDEGETISVPNPDAGYSERFCKSWCSVSDDLIDELMTEWDYCEVEELLYNYSVECGADDFFAQTEMIGSIGKGFPIYVQERVTVFGGRGEVTIEQTGSDVSFYDEVESEVFDTLEAYYNLRGDMELFNVAYGLPKVWLIDFYLYYGIDEVGTLLTFIQESKIGDLHIDNVGYKNHRPIILDYASFNG